MILNAELENKPNNDPKTPIDVINYIFVTF